jgi:imidazolonepropionase-like amidohydrolase
LQTVTFSALSTGLAALVLALAVPTTSNAEPVQPKAQMDHILLGASDLERAMIEFERVTGVRPQYGGKHPFGTHNALVSLGNGLYIELIALQPGAKPPPFFPQLAALENLTQNLTPIGWAASITAPQQTRQRLDSEGLHIGEARAGSRIKPGGTTLQWEVFELERQLRGAPLFISWAPDSVHPSTTSPTGCKLQSFTIATPERDMVSRLVSILEISIPVLQAPTERFTLALDCPKGKVVFETVAHDQSASVTVAIRGVTVVDVRDGSLDPERTVVVAGNRIAAVGAAREITVPDDAEIVEGAGRYLIPGLWDMHVHSIANVALDKSTGEIAAQDWHFPLFLAHGVTGVRNMNDGTADLTLELTKSVKRQLAQGELHGPPRFLSAGPSLDGDPPLGSNPVVVRTAAEARAAVDQLAANGADLVKVYENLSREAYFAIMDEARRRKIAVDGHVPFRITPEEVADAGQRTAEHPEAIAVGCSKAADSERRRFAKVLDDYENLPDEEKFLAMFRHTRALYDSRDPGACASAIAAYRRNGVAVTVDLVAYHHVVNAEQILGDAARMQLVPQEIRRNWEKWFASETIREFQSILRPIVPLELENVRLLNEAGVLLLAATDVGVPLQVPGISLHVELERLVEAGLTPLEALQTATLNPARVLKMADDLGTIEPGRLADLVLLDANPLEAIRNTQKIRAVVADGRLYLRAELDRLLVASSTHCRAPCRDPQ